MLWLSIKDSLCHLLRVDRSVGVIESPDHIMCKPGARYNCAQAWEGRKSVTTEINQRLSTSSKPERLLFLLQAPGSLLLTPAQLAFSDSVLIWASYVRLTAKTRGSIQSNDLWRAAAAEWDESLFGLWDSEPLLNFAVRYDLGGVGRLLHSLMPYYITGLHWLL